MPFHAVALTEFAFNVAALPFRSPAVRVISPVKTWFKDTSPRSRVPPTPFIASPAPFKLPVIKAVPPVFVIEASPVVAKDPIV